MKIFYDWEFLEQGGGKPIWPISVGMVREDGRQLYLVNENVQRDGWLHQAIVEHDWLMQNVVPHLPLASTWGGGPTLYQRHGNFRAHFQLDLSSEAVVPEARMREAIAGLVLSAPEPELWAWYGAYDHVVMSQLFGRMIDLPAGFPMWTNDLQQEIVRLGSPELPAPQQAPEHHALADACQVQRWHAWLKEYERQKIERDLLNGNG